MNTPFNPMDAKPEQEPREIVSLNVGDARSGVVILLTNMPQAAATTMPLISDYDDLRLMTEPVFLSMIEQWLEHYSGVVATMKSSAASMANELSELRNQRAAIRSFLGTTNQGDS